jgi:hypothetical protein
MRPSPLAYYLEWHMRQRLAPMLFDDIDKEAAAAMPRAWSRRRNAHRPLSPSRPCAGPRPSESAERTPSWPGPDPAISTRTGLCKRCNPSLQ